MKYISQAGIIQIAIASPNASQTLRKILAIFSPEDQLTLINQKNVRGNPIIHRAIKHPEALQTILALCPEHDRLEGIRQKKQQKTSALHLAAGYPESLKMILNLYPESDRLKAIKQTNEASQSVLPDHKPKSLKITDLYPKR